MWFDLVKFLFIINISSEAPYGVRTYFYHNTQLSIELVTLVHTTSRKNMIDVYARVRNEITNDHLIRTQNRCHFGPNWGSLRYLVGSQ